MRKHDIYKRTANSSVYKKIRHARIAKLSGICPVCRPHRCYVDRLRRKRVSKPKNKKRHERNTI